MSEGSQDSQRWLPWVGFGGREGQAIQINSGGGGGAGASSSRPWSPISGGLDRRPPLSVSVEPEDGRRAVAPASYEDDDDDNVLSSTQQVTWKEDIEEEAPARRRVPPPSSGQPVSRRTQGGGSGKTGRAAAGKGTRGRKVASGSLRQKGHAPVRAQSKEEQRQRPVWNSDVKSIVPSEAPALGALKKRGNRITEASTTRATSSSLVRKGGRGEWGGEEQAAVAPTVDAYMQQQIKDLAGIALTHSLAVEQYSAQTRQSTSRSPSSSPSRTRHQAHRPRSAPLHVPVPPPSSSSSRGVGAKGVSESQGVVFTRKVSALDKTQRTVKVVRKEPARAPPPSVALAAAAAQRRGWGSGRSKGVKQQPLASPYMMDPGFGTQFGSGGFEALVKEMQAVDRDMEREGEGGGAEGGVEWFLSRAVQGVNAANEERMAALTLEAKQSRDLAGEAVSQVKDLVEAWTIEISRLKQQQQQQQQQQQHADILPSSSPPARNSVATMAPTMRTAATSPKSPGMGSTSFASHDMSSGGMSSMGSNFGLRSEAGRQMVRQNVDALAVRLLDDVLEETVLLLDAQEKAVQLQASIEEAERERERLVSSLREGGMQLEAMETRAMQYSDGAAWEERGRDVRGGKDMGWEWGKRREGGGGGGEEEEGWFEAEEGEEAAGARQLVERVSRNRDKYVASLQEWENALFTGSLNQWNVEDRIAEDIIDEVLEGVAKELDSAMDGVVTDLVKSESLPATAKS